MRAPHRTGSWREGTGPVRTTEVGIARIMSLMTMGTDDDHHHGQHTRATAFESGFGSWFTSPQDEMEGRHVRSTRAYHLKGVGLDIWDGGKEGREIRRCFITAGALAAVSVGDTVRGRRQRAMAMATATATATASVPVRRMVRSATLVVIRDTGLEGALSNGNGTPDSLDFADASQSWINRFESHRLSTGIGALRRSCSP